ncbi:hypothetical protein PLANTIT3_30278 [Plantibacter sp. T3]|nr:hypothetical protein PLANTIT3_30278 [Plantibacter sp. T3]
MPRRTPSVHGRVAGRHRHGADQRAATGAPRHDRRAGPPVRHVDDREEPGRPSGIVRPRRARRSGAPSGRPQRRGRSRADDPRWGRRRRDHRDGPDPPDARSRRRDHAVAVRRRGGPARGRRRGRGREEEAQQVDLAAHRSRRPARHRAGRLVDRGLRQPGQRCRGRYAVRDHQFSHSEADEVPDADADAHAHGVPDQPERPPGPVLRRAQHDLQCCTVQLQRLQERRQPRHDTGAGRHGVRRQPDGQRQDRFGHHADRLRRDRGHQPADRGTEARQVGAGGRLARHPEGRDLDLHQGRLARRAERLPDRGRLPRLHRRRLGRVLPEQLFGPVRREHHDGHHHGRHRGHALGVVLDPLQHGYLLRIAFLGVGQRHQGAVGGCRDECSQGHP